MNKIQCNGFSTKLKLDDGALNNFTGQELEILEYAVVTYGFINCTCFGPKYSVSIQFWIDEIENIYDVNCERNKAVISVLKKLL